MSFIQPYLYGVNGGWRFKGESLSYSMGGLVGDRASCEGIVMSLIRKVKAEFNYRMGVGDILEKRFIEWEEAYLESLWLSWSIYNSSNNRYPILELLIKSELYLIEKCRPALYDYLSAIVEENPRLKARIKNAGGIVFEKGFQIAIEALHADRMHRQTINSENKHFIEKYSREIDRPNPWNLTLEDASLCMPSFEELKKYVALKGIRSWGEYEKTKKPPLFPTSGIAPFKNIYTQHISPSELYPREWVSEADFFGLEHIDFPQPKVQEPNLNRYESKKEKPSTCTQCGKYIPAYGSCNHGRTVS